VGGRRGAEIRAKGWRRNLGRRDIVVKGAAGFWEEVGGDLRRGIGAVAGEDAGGLENI
jgi:hypothetical protein